MFGLALGGFTETIGWKWHVLGSVLGGVKETISVLFMVELAWVSKKRVDVW